MKRLVIVGGGLTGLFSACLARRQGAAVTLIAAGRGGLTLSPGRIGLWRGPLDSAILAALNKDHPYRIAGMSTIAASVKSFTNMTSAMGLAYAGETDRVVTVPTPSGPSQRVCLYPPTLGWETEGSDPPVAVAGMRMFRDLSSALATRRVQPGAAGWRALPDLPMPTFDFRRDAYATDLAGWLETTPLDRLVSAWRAVVSGVGRLGLPAVLGLRQHERVRKELEAGLGVSLFEIPTLPPSVPGLRLELALRSAAMELGVRMIEGARAAARVERNSGSLRCSSVTAEGPSGLRPHAAEAVLLATGGPLHGGWQAPRRGVPRESVFGIPLDPPLPQEQWTSPSYFAPQPYMRLGLRVDQDLRPLGENGDPLAENVFAAGGILAGADRRAEGSREGIDLATAYMAVAKALA